MPVLVDGDVRPQNHVEWPGQQTEVGLAPADPKDSGTASHGGPHPRGERPSPGPLPPPWGLVCRAGLLLRGGVCGGCGGGGTWRRGRGGLPCRRGGLCVWGGGEGQGRGAVCHGNCPLVVLAMGHVATGVSRSRRPARKMGLIFRGGVSGLVMCPPPPTPHPPLVELGGQRPLQVCAVFQCLESICPKTRAVRTAPPPPPSAQCPEPPPPPGPWRARHTHRPAGSCLLPAPW